MRHLKTVKKRGHNKIIDVGTATLFEGEKRKLNQFFTSISAYIMSISDT